MKVLRAALAALLLSASIGGVAADPSAGGATREWGQVLFDFIRARWLPPPGTSPEAKCTVDIHLLPNGEVVSVAVAESSNDKRFDDSMVNAVYKSSPVPIPNDRSVFRSSVRMHFSVASLSGAEQREEMEAQQQEDASRKKQQQVQQCRASQPYQLYLAQERVQREVNLRNGARAELERQDRIQRISGASDPQTRYAAGVILEGADARISAAFQEYRSRGGQATSADDVEEPAKSPCADIQ